MPQSASGPDPVISSVIEEIRNADTIALSGFDHTKQARTVSEAKVEAATDSVEVKSALVDLLKSQNWIFDARGGESLATAMSVQLRFVKKNGEIVSISFLANSFLVIKVRNAHGAMLKSFWFDGGVDSKVNDVFWRDLFKKHRSAWKEKM